jgi:hypothetical protein
MQDFLDGGFQVVTKEPRDSEMAVLVSMASVVAAVAARIQLILYMEEVMAEEALGEQVLLVQLAP